MERKRIAALTMVRGDDFYLRKWIEYYGRELGRENLYVYFDGKDQTVPDFCDGVNVSLEEKIPGKVVELDRRRLAFLSDRAANLFACGYDLVIGTDADEFLVVDPRLGVGLSEFLSSQRIRTSISGLGVDVGQKLPEESDITLREPFLSQRHYARLSTRYTKPSVLAASDPPLRWGSGFHRVKGHNFHICKDLYLFHFGYFDLARIRSRFEDPSRRQGGWEGHLRKRSKTIRLVSSRRSHDWDKATRLCRLFQTLCRPPYALNKPAMMEAVVIVRIPDRFSAVV